MIVRFATSNVKKVEAAQRALGEFGITVEQVDIDLIESRAEDSADIAMEKARQAFKELGHPVIVDDTGFYIEALGGFPMTHVKFSLKTLGINNILQMMENKANRCAEWRTTLAFVWGVDKFKSFTFAEKGELAKEVRPELRPMMSDYHRVFIPKIMSPDNQLALSEIIGDELVKWRRYTATHNHYQMFGKWYSTQNEM
jgi:XTP/dITP diphosphohydrolase